MNPIKRAILRDALIAATIGSALWLNGCATQPPPPSVVTVPPPKKEVYVPPDPYAELPDDVTNAIRHNETPTPANGITTLFPYSPDVEWRSTASPCVQLRFGSIRTSTPTRIT